MHLVVPTMLGMLLDLKQRKSIFVDELVPVLDGEPVGLLDGRFVELVECCCLWRSVACGGLEWAVLVTVCLWVGRATCG
jgi:hypothetical protein